MDAQSRSCGASERFNASAVGLEHHPNAPRRIRGLPRSLNDTGQEKIEPTFPVTASRTACKRSY